MAILLEGKLVADRIKAVLRERCASFKLTPHLASVQVGESAEVSCYSQSQKRTAEKLGIVYQHHVLPQDSSERDVADFIGRLNADRDTHGIIIQLPLPQHLPTAAIVAAVDPGKDVEGVHPVNIGRLMYGQAGFSPCTASAVMELLKESDVLVRGKEAVVVGSGIIAGKPVVLMLLEQMATVTACHIATSEAGHLQEHVSRADILITAVGKPGVIKGSWIKEGAIVVDVGAEWKRRSGRNVVSIRCVRTTFRFV